MDRWNMCVNMKQCLCAPHSESDFWHIIFVFTMLSTLPSRWTRREQADFYRTVSSFGVVYDPDRKAFDWSQFRALARLERKTDESLERYFNSFVNMCRTACKLPQRKEEGKDCPRCLLRGISLCPQRLNVCFLCGCLFNLTFSPSPFCLIIFSRFGGSCCYCWATDRRESSKDIVPHRAPPQDQRAGRQ